MHKQKKSLFTVVVALLCAALMTFTVFANALGDINNDTKITAADARLALRAAVNLEKIEKGTDKFNAADVNHDGKITAADARLILRAAVGLQKLEPAEDDHTHQWGEWTRVPRANAGYHVRTCSVCGKEDRENCTLGTERFTDDKDGLTEPTCTKAATFYQLCTVCQGKKYTTLEALHHSKKEIVDAKSQPAGFNPDGTMNCLADGWNYYTCPVCGENGDTLPELFETVPAPGHTPSSATITVVNDVVCTRCNKTLRPSFNTMVNAIRQDEFTVSNVSKTDSNGTVKNSTLRIPDAAKWLMERASEGESFTEEDIMKQLTDELAKEDTIYNGYLLNSPYIYNYYPISFSNTVSALTEKDVKSIREEEVSKIDFMEEIPANVRLQQNNYYRDVDLADFIAQGNTTGKICKVTVELKEEKYSTIKDSTEETALMHATGVDVRSYKDQFNQQEPGEDGFEMNMTCKDLTSNCTIVYYFLTAAEGDTTTYKPIASKYVASYDVNQHIDIKAGMPISELGIEDSGFLNIFFSMFGLKQGDELVFMEGALDLDINNTSTDYYLLNEIAN